MKKIVSWAVFFGLVVSVVFTATSAQAKVATCGASTPVVSRPYLQVGDSGSCVVELQKRLKTHGAAVVPDGQFGPRTQAAVIAFQKRFRIVRQNGGVDFATWKALVTSSAPTPVKSPNPGTGWSTTYGPNHTSAVLLTYDDCPKSLSQFKSFVNEAERLGVTVAVLPYQNCKNIDAAYARAHGQLVAGHSVSHPNLATLSAAQVKAQLDRYSRQSGVMRPPYGSHNATVRRVAADNGVRLWLWSLDTNDWRGKTGTQVVAYVVGNARPGDTVLMHMNHAAFYPSSLKAIKDGLSKKGLKVCSLAAGRAVAKAGGKIPNSIPC